MKSSGFVYLPKFGLAQCFGVQRVNTSYNSVTVIKTQTFPPSQRPAIPSIQFPWPEIQKSLNC